MIDQGTPFFSIIIPTNNSSATIKLCLDSIASQTYLNFEVIIIDNNSNDSTLEIINGFESCFVVKCYSDKDNGLYEAMNKGITHSAGNYIYFLGSDDSLYNANVLHAVHNAILLSKAEIIYGNVIMRGSNKWVTDGALHAGEFDLKRLISHNICHQSLFYHKSVFKKVGNYNLRYPVFADHDLNLRCAAYYEFRYLDLIIANFKVGGASTHLIDIAFEQDRYANFIKYFFGKLHTRAFVDLRLYVQKAAFTKNANLSLLTRIYCLCVYSKLKVQSFFN